MGKNSKMNRIERKAVSIEDDKWSMLHTDRKMLRKQNVLRTKDGYF